LENDAATNLDGTGGDGESAADILSPEKGSSVNAGVEVSEIATRALVGRMAEHAEQNGTELPLREGREMTSAMEFEIGTALHTRNGIMQVYIHDSTRAAGFRMTSSGNDSDSEVVKLGTAQSDSRTLFLFALVLLNGRGVRMDSGEHPIISAAIS
jgi:hypothetical protein